MASQRSIEAAGTISDSDLLEKFRKRRRSSPVNDDRISLELKDLAEIYGRPPTIEELRADMAPGERTVDLERCLFDWELRQTEPHPGSREHMERLARQALERRPSHGMSLVPVAEGWQVPTLFGWFEYDKSSDVLAAALRLLNDRYGAEVWSYSSTMMLFKVAKPPTTPDAAFELALLHEDIAGDGWWAFMDYTYRSHARELLGSNRWTLWTKP